MAGTAALSWALDCMRFWMVDCMAECAALKLLMDSSNYTRDASLAVVSLAVFIPNQS